MPAPFNLGDLDSYWAQMLACIILLKVKRQSGSKPMYSWSWQIHPGIFNALL